MSTHEDGRVTIDWLVADLRPVRRLPTLGRRFGAWVTVVAALLVVAAFMPRADLADHLRAGAFVLEMAGLAAAVLVLGALALRSAAPDRVPTRREAGLTIAFTALAIGTALAGAPPTDLAPGAILARAGGCLWSTLAFGVGPALALFAGLRRGAPVEPHAAGAYAGGAGLVLAYLAMRLHCPLDDAVHLGVGHLLPVAVGTAFASMLGGAWLGCWHRRLR